MRDRTQTVVIFDFDGTLADTLDAIVTITNHIADEFGYPTADRDDVTALQSMSSWQIIRRSGVSIFQIPKLLRRVREELQENLPAIELFPGISEALTDLKRDGYQLYIITSNSQDNVEFVLEKYGILKIFNSINSESTLFGKNRIINRLLKREKIAKHRVIYVGDETRDIRAAKKSKIKSIAVSWGFNSPDILAEHRPDRLVTFPKEIPDAIASFSHRNRPS